jgi:hypothetical protein
MIDGANCHNLHPCLPAEGIRKETSPQVAQAAQAAQAKETPSRQWGAVEAVGRRLGARLLNIQATGASQPRK